MKRKSNLVLFVCITFAIIMLSISSTLALVKDDESKVGNIIKFDKVAIMGDVEGGSKLSVNIDDRNVGNTIEVIGENFGGEELYIKPAPGTREMYLRFRVYFTFGDEELDDANKDALNSFMTEDGFPMGFELYSNEDYKFLKSNGWAYLVTKDSEDLLKVVTENDSAYVICNKYIMGLDLQYETQIINVIETNNLGHLQMKVEAQAIQAYGLANLTVEEGNEILSSGTETLEEKFGNATIADYEKASEDNIDFKFDSGLPSKRKVKLENWTWDEIKAASNLIEKAYDLGYLKITVKTMSNNTQYDEIENAVPNCKVDGVLIQYSITGTYGQSNYDRIFTFTDNYVTNKIHLRDEKILKITLDNKDVEIPMMVSNFLHDNKSSGRAGITFTSKTVIPNITQSFGYLYTDTESRVDSTPRGYYRDCTIRNYLQTTVLNAIKASIGNDIVKAVNKSANYGSTPGLEQYITPTNYESISDTIWLLDRDELIKNANDEGRKWYPIYATPEDRIKVNVATNGTQTNVTYATRLVATHYHRYKTYAYRHCGYGLGHYMNSNGSGLIRLDRGSYNSIYNTAISIAFGFCV